MRIGRKKSIPTFLRDNGLSLLLLVCFLGLWAMQAVAGHRVWLEEQRARGSSPDPGLRIYLSSAHFWQATSENWESEFLQMAIYVLFTVFLFQRGSAESKDPDDPAPEVNRPPDASRPGAPRLLRRRGMSWIYSSSLTLAFLLLFAGSFTLHVWSGAARHAEELSARGLPVPRHFTATAQLWFESLQNWQSEFLSVLSMVYLSIYLRQRGSPESKPVDAPHHATGKG
jgi:hypothetical protein